LPGQAQSYFRLPTISGMTGMYPQLLVQMGVSQTFFFFFLPRLAWDHQFSQFQPPK
jgi:hypothetical protein